MFLTYFFITYQTNALKIKEMVNRGVLKNYES